MDNHKKKCHSPTIIEFIKFELENEITVGSTIRPIDNKENIKEYRKEEDRSYDFGS